jgi:hypothetical protein
MSSPPQPYRSGAGPAPGTRTPGMDVPGVGARLTGYVVVAWAAARVALCSVRGFDLQGSIALGVFLVFVASITGASHAGPRPSHVRIPRRL